MSDDEKNIRILAKDLQKGLGLSEKAATEIATLAYRIAINKREEK